mmetsp:Transcript_1946/g.2823  ORF Transcript_1946/g.2823 Transcript_1946/m.2823 type:complete len:208 (+) Transcript_1946:382-1005(+)
MDRVRGDEVGAEAAVAARQEPLAMAELRHNLPPEAAGHDPLDDLGDPVDDVRQLPQVLVEDRREVADARQHLHAVGEAYDLVVDGIRVELLGVHQVDAREAQAQRVAEAPLEPHAARVPPAHLGEVAAAHFGHVALAAHVVVDAAAVLFEHCEPPLGREAAREEPRAAAGQGLLARCVAEVSLECVWPALQPHEGRVFVASAPVRTH